jgi:alpha-amylase/alpha-mannosidase (GH57 family)
VGATHDLPPLEKGKSPILDLVFIWHMHQPDYRDRAQRKILLPWVRLHALKDYYDMPARLRQFEGIHQTFNLVPSLVEQIECYLSGTWQEDELDLFLRRAEDLTEEQKHLILKSFFLSPEEHMIRPYPRYASLLRDFRLRGSFDILHRWTSQEWRDLQFWRQLTWIDPSIRSVDESLDALYRQGQNFDENQKKLLLERIWYWLQESLDIYKTLQDEGRLEVSITPFYHPILPLLMDPATVHEALPSCPLPDPHGHFPEDAQTHMERAITFYEQHFGRKPLGVWPSEGSVSEGVAALLGELGIRWFASDEEILARSLGVELRKNPDDPFADPKLYMSYATLEGQGPTILFRDHHLSDLIGFQYATWNPQDAANHLIAQILGIYESWHHSFPPLVTIILDGENCWEHYEADGGPFLTTLYQNLQNHPIIRCKTVTEALTGREPQPLQRLAAGSWINGNFYIWMGEEADRRAWALLTETRQVLVTAEQQQTVSPQKLQEAWEELYVAEGSDWFWWFGESQQSQQNAIFDEMFRLHLLRIYELIGKPLPPALHNPIETSLPQKLGRVDAYLVVSPQIDGKETHYYEWRAAARYIPSQQGGTMQQVGKSPVQSIIYGVNHKKFFLRIDPSSPINRSKADWRYELRITGPTRFRLRFIPTPTGLHAYKMPWNSTDHFESERPDGTVDKGGYQCLPEVVSTDLPQVIAKEETIFETAIPWEILECQPGEVLSFFVGCPSGKNEVALVPSLSSLYVTAPEEKHPGSHWFP